MVSLKNARAALRKRDVADFSRPVGLAKVAVLQRFIENEFHFKN
jgi:hypothetical protein